MPCLDVVVPTAIASILLFQMAYLVLRLLTVRGSGRTKEKPSIMKRDWKKDVVYLYQFPRPRSCKAPNLLPYCVKLETFLRVNKIEYELEEVMLARSQEKKLPFVEFNGEHLHDSQFIISYLTKYFGIDDGLTEPQRGIMRAISRMLDNGTFYCILYNKLGTNTQAFVNTILNDTHPIIKRILAPLTYLTVWDILTEEGTGRHSQAEMESILREDLKALNEILGDNEWLVGDKPTLADCSFFGHIAATYTLPYDLPIKRLLEEEYPRLKSHYKKIGTTFFNEIFPESS